MNNKKYKIKNYGYIKISICAALLILQIFSVALSVGADSKDNSKKSQVIVSLGDSYSSGEGIEPFYGQDESVEDKVKNPDWLAHRSQKSWAGMLVLPSVDGTMADNLGENWYFAAVSGAVTDNLLNYQKKEYDKSFGKYSGTYNIEPQLNVFDKLGKKKADYVTLTLGGNDAGFSDIITEAALGSTYLNKSKLDDMINETWKDFYKGGGIRDKLQNAYENIAKKAGKDSHIVVAGYPNLLDSNGKGALFSLKEATMINDAVSDFNANIKNIVQECRDSGMKISFASVEEEFKGREAYSKEPYLNGIILLPKSEDLTGKPPSAYSMHPNYDGARAYAKCVQKKIDEIESGEETGAETVQRDAAERDIVLVLDVSGSMAGDPLEETKKAATKFIGSMIKEDALAGVVTYSDTAKMNSDFSDNENLLENAVNVISANGGTNIEAGLQRAHGMLSRSGAKKKIIVLMSDGEPNQGKIGDELISYAASIKDENVSIYTLGFFGSVGGEKSSAQLLMEKIASDGRHYEVSNADDLIFSFGDIADQINGQKYIYVRIACPVDVTVSYGGETLCSKEENLNERTKFGVLTFEENENKSDGDGDDRIKVLRLKEGEDYDVRIEGNGLGRMNYTIGFMDDDGEYSDLRKFSNIKISKRTVIDTVAKNSDSTVLNVDEDGDGKYDLKYKATENGEAKIVDYSYVCYIAIGAVAVVALTIIIIKIKKHSKNKQTR